MELSFDTSGIERTLNSNSAFARQALQAGTNVIADIAPEMAREMVEEVDKIVEQELNTNRDQKRRKRGDTPLEGSFRCSFQTATGFITFRLHSIADPVKVNSLEYGSEPHDIDGSPWLIFPPGNSTRSTLFRKYPNNRPGRVGGYPKLNSVSREYGNSAGKTIRTPHVDHPGNRAYRFMQRGVDRVVERYLKSARL